MPTRKCQCFDRIAKEPSNTVTAREQSKTLNYTDPFKIDQITLHEIFRVIRLTILCINLICNWSYSEYEYMYIFYIPVKMHTIQNVWEDTIYIW